jgi:hypothetical protein
VQHARQFRWHGYGKTTIKMNTNVHVYDHHLTHPINVLLRDYNDFVRLVLKQMSRSDK